MADHHGRTGAHIRIQGRDTWASSGCETITSGYGTRIPSGQIIGQDTCSIEYDLVLTVI